MDFYHIQIVGQLEERREEREGGKEEFRGEVGREGKRSWEGKDVGRMGGLGKEKEKHGKRQRKNQLISEVNQIFISHSNLFMQKSG